MTPVNALLIFCTDWSWTLTGCCVSERTAERVLAEGHTRNQQLQEHMAQQLVHTLGTTVSNRLDKVLREEMKKSVPQSKSQSVINYQNAKVNTVTQS